MKTLIDYKDSVHKCSKCGLCQAVCPLYKITGNDCTVSRGQFVMLKGIISGDIKMSSVVNKYMNMCLKCGACTKFCPSGIDVVDVISAAKYEYFKAHRFERLKSYIKKTFVFGILLNLMSLFKKRYKSKHFTTKVLYFGGCGSKVLGNTNVVKLLNSLEIEVITPDFSCCGIWAYTSGDLETFQDYIKGFVEKVRKTGITDIVTACASCEKTLKDYIRLTEDSEMKEFLSKLKIKSVYTYIKENNLQLKLKEPATITYHKPCNTSDYESIEWILHNTENLNYTEMCKFDQCCGLNGLSNFGARKIFSELSKDKRNCIKSSGADIVLTTCLGCESALKMYSRGEYKVFDLLDFLINNSAD